LSTNKHTNDELTILSTATQTVTNAVTKLPDTKKHKSAALTVNPWEYSALSVS